MRMLAESFAAGPSVCRRKWPRIVALFAFLLPACAPLLDWGDLTNGADASVVDASHDRGAADGKADGEAVDASLTDGQADAPPAPDPCASVNCPLCNGYYCGESSQHNFGGGDPGTLYECVDGSTLSAEHCTTDCIISQSGRLADCCDHCAGFSNGTYCGSTLAYNGGYNHAFDALQNVIFSCDGGVYSGTQVQCDAATTCVQNGTIATCQ